MKIVLHAGLSWSLWSPHLSDLETQTGLGGSLVAAVRVAHALALHDPSNQVILFGDMTEQALKRPSGLPNLVFKPLSDYESAVAPSTSATGTTEEIDLLVVSRYAQFLRFGSHIKKVFYWCHDMDHNINTALLQPQDSKFAVLALSPWHKQRLVKTITSQRVLQTSNGIEPSLFADEPWSRKVPNRFIYSSAIYRGLDTVLNCWPTIRARLPDATLHIYSDFASPLVVSRMKALGQELKTRADALQSEGVSCFGFVGQRQLQQAWYEADVWFYPTSFEETYCITALEAQASGALCVYAPVAALCDTVGKERGLPLPERKFFASDKDYEQMAANAVCTVLESSHKEALKEKRVKAREWALAQTWQAVAAQWLAEIAK